MTRDAERQRLIAFTDHVDELAEELVKHTQSLSREMSPKDGREHHA